MNNVLLVTDPGVVAAGHAERVQQSLEKVGLKTVLFDKVRENPDHRRRRCNVWRSRKAAGIDGIIGLGGGSSMDTAKGCNFLLTNGGRMQDYWGVGKASRPMLPLIAIPTTAGTGSECQSFALIADEETHQKMACGDPKAAARVAILDPALTFRNRRAWPPARDWTRFRMRWKPRSAKSATPSRWPTRGRRCVSARHPCRWCCRRWCDLEARAGMLLGAALGGLAIENSMLGAAHAAANPLTAHFHIVHGQAVGLMLPSVIRFNAADPDMARLYDEMGETKSARLAAKVEWLLNLAGMPRSLAECGVTPSSIPLLAAEAAKQWTANFNPRPVAEKDFIGLFQSALGPRGQGAA